MTAPTPRPINSPDWPPLGRRPVTITVTTDGQILIEIPGPLGPVTHPISRAVAYEIAARLNDWTSQPTTEFGRLIDQDSRTYVLRLDPDPTGWAVIATLAVTGGPRVPILPAQARIDYDDALVLTIELLRALNLAQPCKTTGCHRTVPADRDTCTPCVDALAPEDDWDNAPEGAPDSPPAALTADPADMTRAEFDALTAEVASHGGSCDCPRCIAWMRASTRHTGQEN